MFNKFSIFNRPIAPHLLIYSSQLSSSFSIWHRISGVILVILLTNFVINIKLVLGFNFSSFFITSKILITFFSLQWIINYFYLFSLLVLLYHSFNGIRHIIWDLGFFLNFTYLFWSSITLIFCVFLILVLNLISL